MSPDTTRRQSAKFALLIASPVAALAIGFPAAALAQQATFANDVVSIPAVRVGNLDYPNVTLGLVPNPSTLAFRLTGVGQPSASSGATNVFDGSTLTLPSVLVSGWVFRDVVLTLTNPSTYEFVLSGYTPPLAQATPLTSAQIGDTQWADGNTASGGQGQPMGGIACGAVVDTYHTHAHLSIFMNGRQLAIPANIGLLPSCGYALHTHDRSGKLHTESATPVVHTLGQLFDVWGQPLSSTNVAGITGLPVVVYVTDNGVTTRHTTGDPRQIQLTAKRLITIQLGSPVATIPNYTWD